VAACTITESPLRVIFDGFNADVTQRRRRFANHVGDFTPFAVRAAPNAAGRWAFGASPAGAMGAAWHGPILAFAMSPFSGNLLVRRTDSEAGERPAGARTATKPDSDPHERQTQMRH
jgi:hypothetical protein